VGSRIAWRRARGASPLWIEHDVLPRDRASAEDDASSSRSPQRTEDTTILVGKSGRFAIGSDGISLSKHFVTCRARGRDAVLILFGDGPERQRMQEIAGDSTRIHAGFSKDSDRSRDASRERRHALSTAVVRTFGLSIAEAMKLRFAGGCSRRRRCKRDA